MKAANLSLTLILLNPLVALGTPLSDANRQDPYTSGDLLTDLKGYGLTTFVSLVVKAGLAETLASVQPATIFAPSNYAFSDLPVDVFEKLISDHEFLKSTLLYHFVPNTAIRSSDLKLENKVTTATGASLRVNVYPSSEYLAVNFTVNGVTVDNLFHDISAGEGTIVHVLKNRILPTVEIADNLAVVLKKESTEDKPFGFNTLLTALSAADLAETVSTTDGLTVFAPTDEAFRKLPQATLDNLLKPENKDKLVAVLTRHVVPQTLFYAGINLDDGINDSQYQTLEPKTTLSFRGPTLPPNVKTSLGQEARLKGVPSLDIVATNGVIHVIDTVLA